MKSCSVWYLMLVELLDSWNVCYWVWMQLARFLSLEIIWDPDPLHGDTTRTHFPCQLGKQSTFPKSGGLYKASVDVSKRWILLGSFFCPETLCSCRGCLVTLLQDDQDVLADRNRSQVDPIFPRSTMLSCGYERISGQGPMDLWMMQFFGGCCFFLSRYTKHLQLFFLVTWTKCGSFFAKKIWLQGSACWGSKSTR